MKLPELELKRGAYQGTNGYGHDVYAAPYYVVKEVDEYIKVAKTMYKELRELRAKLAAMESQKPFRWALDHFSLGVGTTLFDSEKEAIDFSRNLAGSSKAIPLYAKPMPADKPERITEQDAREIAKSALSFWRNTVNLTLDVWLKDHAPALLNKLNADREQVPEVPTGC